MVELMGGLFVVLQRACANREEAREMLLAFQQDFSVVGTEQSTLISALDLPARHQIKMWDALIVNVAADARCTMLLTEDLEFRSGHKHMRGVLFSIASKWLYDPSMERKA